MPGVAADTVFVLQTRGLIKPVRHAAVKRVSRTRMDAANAALTLAHRGAEAVAGMGAWISIVGVYRSSSSSSSSSSAAACASRSRCRRALSDATPSVVVCVQLLLRVPCGCGLSGCCWCLKRLPSAR